MSTKSYEIPDDCYYSRSDEWIRPDGERVLIGITDYAQSELSDIVFIDFPDVGKQVEAGQDFGIVESVKAVSDLYAPISGEVVEVHEALAEHPEWVNEDPYERGWMVALTPDDTDWFETLLSAEQYRKYVEERAGT
jgi:glycine cleavage system H protein